MAEFTEYGDILTDTLDLHIHVGPDVLPRKYTIEELVATERDIYQAVCPKTHGVPMVPPPDSDLRVIPSSITLNQFVGGLNPSAVYAASRIADEPLIVWLPTIHAQHHIDNLETDYEIPMHWVGRDDFHSRRVETVDGITLLDDDGNLTDDCLAVLEMIADVDAILATGHVSPGEGREVALEARARNVTCIVTHVFETYLDYPIDVQQELAAAGAFLEHCREIDRHHTDPNHRSKRVSAIQAVGAEHCLVSSDAGQVSNPNPSACLEEFIEILRDSGLPREDIETMAVESPRRVLSQV